ncbi:MAG: dihydropteridine reductase [Clostridiales bacterium]|nr:dihydropteridine reductase [Clostridiales bacterium]
MNNTQTSVATKISNQYVEQPVTTLDKLKALDKKVKRPAKAFAYTFGTIGALVLGTGMCLAMKVIGDLMAVGIVVGCAGILMVSINYAIYKAIMKKRKAKYSQEVLELSQSIIAEENK